MLLVCFEKSWSLIYNFFLIFNLLCFSMKIFWRRQWNMKTRLLLMPPMSIMKTLIIYSKYWTLLEAHKPFILPWPCHNIAPVHHMHNEYWSSDTSILTKLLQTYLMDNWDLTPFLWLAEEARVFRDNSLIWVGNWQTQFHRIASTCFCYVQSENRTNTIEVLNWLQLSTIVVFI